MPPTEPKARRRPKGVATPALSHGSALAALCTPPRGAKASRADAFHLAAGLFGVPRARLFLEAETLPAKGWKRLEKALPRLWKGEPLAYLVGSQPFLDWEFRVDPRVLIPRPETEELVELVCSMATPRPGARLLDIGTGSGCIAIALAARWPDLEVTAVDNSRGALSVARANARDILGPRNKIDFVCVDFLDDRKRRPKVKGPFDLVVSNPPYVGTAEKGEMDESVRLHEPKEALFAGRDGLSFIRRLPGIFGDLMAPNSQIFMEIGHRQGPLALKCMQQLPDFHYSIIQDLRGIGRFLHGRRP